MFHHQTNTLRLEFLLSELRTLIKDKIEHADALLAKNPESKIGRILANEAENLENFFKIVYKKMYELKWVEPTEGNHPRD